VLDTIKSVAAGGDATAEEVAVQAFGEFSHHFAPKLYWYLGHGYKPHAWQCAFHAFNHNGQLKRFRHLVAGRRGGKTLSAAWEVLFYCLYPAQFHMDAHGEVSNEPLWVNVLTGDHELGRPARFAMLKCIRAAGLKANRDYKYNKTEKTIEFFADGSDEPTAFLQFRTAEDPQSLRGAGLDILWIDESAFIRTKEAWDVIRPSLGDNLGIVITTTTPRGKNWVWEEFFQGYALTDVSQARVQYTSIDNPHYRKEEWEYNLRTMHPAMFKQEHMAAFDAMAGLTLDGEWLHFYTLGGQPDGDAIPIPRDERKQISLRKYIGVDPSTGEGEDDFAIVCIGITEDSTQAFLIDYWVGKIPFPDQVDKIREWQLRYRPDMIGIEAQAYQRSLSQQAARLEGFPGIVPVIQPGGRSAQSKQQRIVAMSPVFKIGKVRIHPRHVEFVDQWVSFDATKKENKDDLLDATEITLSVAGVMLPMLATPDPELPPNSLEEEAKRQIEARRKAVAAGAYDIEMGEDPYD